MKIASVWIQGYRSIRDLRLEGLGAANIFYGPNGAGKSNILSALRLFGDLLRLRAIVGVDGLERPLSELGLRERDLCTYSDAPRIVLGVEIGPGARPVAVPLPGRDLTRLRIELTVDISGARGTLGLSRLEDAETGQDLVAYAASPEGGPLRGVLGSAIPDTLFSLIPAVRALSEERSELAGPAQGAPGRAARGLQHLIRQGRLKEALFQAKNSPSLRAQESYERLRSLLSGPPLDRPPFNVVRDPETGEYDLQEIVARPDGERQARSLDLAGLGTQQVYSILASILLSDAYAVGLEEPESHLHGPSSGRHLRVLLRRILDERRAVQQLFIATHSGLFDLDPTGYWDVRLDPTLGTLVERRALIDVDRRHLFETSPARHALMDMLRYLPEGQIVFRHADGRGLTGPEMIRLLQEDDPDALAFLDAVAGAAVNAVRVRAKRSETS